jgi:cytosine deaminase
MLDLVFRSARLPAAPDRLVDVGVSGGRIAAIEPRIEADAEIIEAVGRLVAPGFVETHIHLDKSCILDRCVAQKGTLDEAIANVAKAKAGFTCEDVTARARRTLERCICQGTTHMRTHVEVDPGIGLRGFEGVLALVDEYRWAIDIELCIFPQEGLLNNPGTDELMVEALRRGGTVVGAAPYTDSDPHGQIDRVFEMAREFDIDIDMHLDFGPDPDNLDLVHVCRRTEEYGYGGRVAIGHVTKLAQAEPDAFAAAGKRLAEAGVALTVLPSTDLYLMGRQQTHANLRGVTHAHRLLHHGVNCSLATNNVLNPFTPFGDCSPIRMANLYANIAHVGAQADVSACFDMITSRPARLMNLDGYGLGVGDRADLVLIDATGPAAAVAELAPVLGVWKNGQRTVTRHPVDLHRP